MSEGSGFFPDDFRLVGTFAERWARLGNAVVPPMARAMGEALKPILLAARQRAA